MTPFAIAAKCCPRKFHLFRIQGTIADFARWKKQVQLPSGMLASSRLHYNSRFEQTSASTASGCSVLLRRTITVSGWRCAHQLWTWAYIAM
jgi:hypothetical protein